MGGTLLVCICIVCSIHCLSECEIGFEGNYDISKMHYDGPGDVPGGGYGYDIRVEGRSSANPPDAAT
jgi:20S proteasome subunit beta 5